MKATFVFLFAIVAALVLAATAQNVFPVYSQTAPVSGTFTGQAVLPVKVLVTITNGIVDGAAGYRFYQLITGPTTVRLTNLTEEVFCLYADNPGRFPITWPEASKLKGVPYSPTNEYPIALFEMVKGKLILTIQ